MQAKSSGSEYNILYKFSIHPLSFVNCLKNNIVSGFHNISLIQSKLQFPVSKYFTLKQNMGKLFWICLTVMIKRVNVAVTCS